MVKWAMDVKPQGKPIKLEQCCDLVKPDKIMMCDTRISQMFLYIHELQNWHELVQYVFSEQKK